MDLCKLFLVKLLEDLKLDGKNVEILTDFPPGKILPSITMSRMGGEYKETRAHNLHTTLDKDNPYFNQVKPDEDYNTGLLWVSSFKANFLLHVWSHSNDERDLIMRRIMELLLWTRHGDSELGSVYLKNIGSVTDLDQFELYPVLYHSTVSLEFLYDFIHVKKVNPLLKIEKNEK